MDRGEIIDALTALAAELEQRGVVAERLGLPGGWLNDAVKGLDEADLRLLAGALGLDRPDEVLAVAERTYGDRLDPAARFFVEQVFG